MGENVFTQFVRSRFGVFGSTPLLVGVGLPAVVGSGLFVASPADALGNDLALTPPMGWNSLNAYGCSVTEADVEAAAGASVADGLKAEGYRYVNVDDCRQAPDRDAAGRLAADPERLPSGIKGLVGPCLDVTGGEQFAGNVDGTPLKLWTCTDGAGQQWRLSWD